MLIASRFKRPTAPVSLQSKDGSLKHYFFRPIDPASPDSEHVAEVAEAEHIQRLLQIPEGYYIAESNAVLDAATAVASKATRPIAAAVPVKPEVATQEPATQAPVAVEQAGSEAATDEDADTSAAAKALIELKLSDIKKALPSTPRAVLRAALAMESGKGNDERVTVVKHLKAALE